MMQIYCINIALGELKKLNTFQFRSPAHLITTNVVVMGTAWYRLISQLGSIAIQLSLALKWPCSPGHGDFQAQVLGPCASVCYLPICLETFGAESSHQSVTTSFAKLSPLVSC